MNNKITATHESGQVITINKADKDIEYTIDLMKHCGYIDIRVEAISK